MNKKMYVKLFIEQWMDTSKQIQFLNWLEMEMLVMDIKEDYEKKTKKENQYFKKE